MMMRRIVSMITCCPALALVNRRAGPGVDLVGGQLVGKLVRRMRSLLGRAAEDRLRARVRAGTGPPA
jgi:hypothetical protein